MIRLFHGENTSHEYWESEDKSHLVLRCWQETCWSAHRDHNFVGSASSAIEAASLLGATLDGSRRFVPDGKVVLVST